MESKQYQWRVIQNGSKFFAEYRRFAWWGIWIEMSYWSMMDCIEETFYWNNQYDAENAVKEFIEKKKHKSIKPKEVIVSQGLQ